MTADKSGMEVIFLGRKVGGDKEKDVQRYTIDANEGVLPLADDPKCGRNILLKLGNRIRAVTTEEVSVSFSTSLDNTYSGENATLFNSSFRAKESSESDKPFPG